jgi:hypothetical protein
MGGLPWRVWLQFVPGGMWLVISVVLYGVVSSVAASPYLGPLLGTLRWAPLAALAMAALSWGWVFYRLWQAENLVGPTCRCSGPLGEEKPGRYGPYRTCWYCGRYVSQRDYE